MKKTNKKLSMEEMIEKLDAAKKANPLDLSSDQDLSIALMNLVSLEEHFFFSGAKTGKVGFYDLINTVRNMRKELMERIVKKSSGEDGEVWCISKHLLAASMRLYEVGTKAMAAGRKKEAYEMFEKAYDLYSLFWGLNMQLIDLTGVKESVPSFYDGASEICADTKTEKKSVKPVKKEEKISGVRRLGQWVKEKVNCCIE
ncbi:MAG: hypothetical protein II843_00830 [Alphaproteobacteria bacterium]|nr:hypothetical protein [Alphaproteobacteria bacterium]MBQ6011873.1 hypothetical protein [Alphaproteobacteria bacterium]